MTHGQAYHQPRKQSRINRGEMIDMKKFIPLAILALLIVPAYVVAARSDTTSGPKPSIVLIHGAWADGSSWSRVTSVPPPPGQSPSCLSGDPTTVFNFVPLTGGEVDLYVKPNLFPSCFANDLSPKAGAVLASTQRAFALSALPQLSGVPAWKTIPSFYLVGTIDNVIPPFAQLIMAQRAHSTIVQVRAGHLSMISHPEAVADLINQAAQTVSGNSNPNSGLTLAPAAL